MTQNKEQNKELKRGQPLYVPKRNPHNAIRKIGTRGPRTFIWQCHYCSATGTMAELDKVACSYVYPPCSYCGCTPICAADCSGIWQALGDPKVYLVGGSPEERM